MEHEKISQVRLSEQERKQVEKIAQQVKKLESNHQMESKLTEIAIAQKKKGKLDNAKLERFRKRLSSELDEKQKKRLNEIIDKLERL